MVSKLTSFHRLRDYKYDRVYNFENEEIDKTKLYAVPIRDEQVNLFRTNNCGDAVVPQIYSELCNKHLQENGLFEDDTFVPSKKLLPLAELPSDTVKKIVWKRPSEISKQPKFIRDGASRFDIVQGLLGDCWLLAALSDLTLHPKLFHLVVPKDQSFVENYAGIFHFRFWQYGKYVDIIVDDRLPTVDGKLIFLRSSDEDEFWAPLVEKAYAKLYGSYTRIVGGQINEALEDLYGGISEYYEASHEELFNTVLTAYERSSLMGCAIISDSQNGENETPSNLLENHAYSITSLAIVYIPNEVRLIRIRNPWGQTEWTGAWSDKSSTWYLVDKETRNELQVQKEDGEFWMCFEDFQRTFTIVDICHLNPNFCLDKNLTIGWKTHEFDGKWTPGVTAGGGLRNKYFHFNPQYCIAIRGPESKKESAVVIALMQKYRRNLSEFNVTMELHIYEVNTDSGEPLPKEFFQKNEPHMSDSGNVRQLTVRLMLRSGNYCIIPSTTRANVAAQYYLRVFTEEHSTLEENDDKFDFTDIRDHNHQHSRPRNVRNGALQLTYKNIAQDEEEIGFEKVQKILNEKFSPSSPFFCLLKRSKLFSQEICKQIVALWDRDGSGKINYSEFEKLIDDIEEYKDIFDKYDHDESGELDGFELKALLLDCGFTVDKNILQNIMRRYGQGGPISFGNFVICLFKLKKIHEAEANNQHVNGLRNINLIF